jgi:hypothetical protein
VAVARCVRNGSGEEIRLDMYIVEQDTNISIAIVVDGPIAIACVALASISDGLHLPGCLEFIVARSTLSPKHAPRHQHKLDPLHAAPVKLKSCEVLRCLTTVADCLRPHCRLFASSWLLAPHNYRLLPSTAPSPSLSNHSHPAMQDSNKDSFQLPAPPPSLQTRDNAMDRPGTPTGEAFMSPQQTPQGSPSKHHQPPGAFDLPHVFENAMRLLPTMGSPSKTKPGSPTSPNKLQIGSNGADYSAQDSPGFAPGSPTRKSNQENTPPSGRPGLQKESSYLTHAAQSRQEPYRTREEGQSTRYINGPQRLSPEDLEKARKPAVKRLANVTQLCKDYSVL